MLSNVFALVYVYVYIYVNIHVCMPHTDITASGGLLCYFSNTVRLGGMKQAILTSLIFFKYTYVESQF